MPEDSGKPHRRSVRLKGCDYARPGAYFVSICTHQKACLLGQVQGGVMQPNRMGEIVQQAWVDLPNHYPHLCLDGFCLMPNHVHAILQILDPVRRGGSSTGSAAALSQPIPPPVRSSWPAQTRPYDPIPERSPVGHALPEIVRALKTFSARRINALRGTPGQPVWQRSFYEHILRNDDDLRRTREYILANPQRWDETR